MNREQEQLIVWLKDLGVFKNGTLEPMLADASLRHYYRLRNAEGSFVLMSSAADLPAWQNFIAVDRAWLALDLRVPRIYEENRELGALLLEDFGDFLYSDVLKDSNVEKLYGLALEALVNIQTCQSIPGYKMQNFLSEIARRDLSIWLEWFVEKWSAYTLSKSEKVLMDDFFDLLLEHATEQPQVCMHRDYHSRNLVALDGAVGILDFQDAMWGPVSYDAVSLLRDCYISWPPTLVEKLLKQFYKRIADKHSDFSEADFLRACDWVGLHRHIKALGTFARKIIRDNDHRYEAPIATTLDYIWPVLGKYTELKAAKELLEKICLKQR